MGEDEVSPSHTAKQSFTEIFESVCPFYIAIGVSYEQFWYGRAEIAKFYRKAHRLKCEEANQKMWMNNLYAHEAFDTVIRNVFKKKGQKAAQYPEKPFLLTGKSRGGNGEPHLNAAKEQKGRVTHSMRASFEIWATQFNRRMRDKAIDSTDAREEDTIGN